MSRHILTAKQKIAVLNDLKINNNQTLLAAKYKVSVSTISRIKNNANEIRAVTNPDKKRDRKSSHVHLETALMTWFNQVRSQNGVVSGPVLLTKAQEIAIKLNEEYAPDRSWIQRWCKRNSINLAKIHGKPNENNTASAAAFISNHFPHILDKFTPDCIFNADETGLYYKAMPNGSYKSKHENAKGFKTQKQRLTLLFLCNATGTFKRAYCIGKSPKPRPLKGKEVPLPYYSNKSAWMTSLIWTQILVDLNKELQKSNKHICLIIDNASCHNTETEFSNITIQFLPPNTTVIIQPLDQGIIHSFKMEYRKVLIKKQIGALEKGLSVGEFLKSLTILDGIRYANQAWNLVKQQTIINCFNKAGIDQIPETDMSPETDAEGENFAWSNLDTDYIHCDNNFSCSRSISDEDVLEENEHPTEDEENFAQSDFSVKHPSTKEALLNLDSLRAYFSYNNINASETFDDIENLILENAEKNKNRTKIRNLFHIIST